MDSATLASVREAGAVLLPWCVDATRKPITVEVDITDAAAELAIFHRVRELLEPLQVDIAAQAGAIRAQFPAGADPDALKLMGETIGHFIAEQVADQWAIHEDDAPHVSLITLMSAKE